MKIKICGIKSAEVASRVISLGAHAIGFVFAKSVRQVSLDTAREIVSSLPPMVQTFGVFVNPSIEEVEDVISCGIDIIQLHGDEPVDFCKRFSSRLVKAIRIKCVEDIHSAKEYEPVVRAFLVDAWTDDAYGGTGKVADWDLASRAVQLLDRPVILAGGLNAGNVTEAIRIVQPYGIDVSSGVESSPGEKDISLIQEFIAKVLN